MSILQEPNHETVCEFDNERMLLSNLAQGDLGLDDSFPVSLVRVEVPVGACIPDLVCVRLSVQPSSTWLPRRWTFRHAFVLSLLRRWKRLKLETIARKVYEHPDRIRPVLDELVKSGTVDVNAAGTFLLSRLIANVQAEVVSVEAKLRRWKDALHQAREYQRFSDKVFVAMERRGIPSTDTALQAFRTMGVGLAAVADNTVDWVVRPRANRLAFHPDREYLICAATSSDRHSLWSARWVTNASRHART